MSYSKPMTGVHTLSRFNKAARNVNVYPNNEGADSCLLKLLELASSTASIKVTAGLIGFLMLLL